MANAQLSLVLRHIRKLAGDGKATDRQLLHRFAKQHEEAAFEMLVERHGPAILGLCRRVLRHEQDAEDVFQATFLTLARKASSIRKPESLGCWLYGVASRLAFKVRAPAAKRKTVRIVQEPVQPSAGQELCAALDEELTRLAWRYQAPIVLCYLQGKTRDEAARQLGWSLGTLKLRLSQGREILRDRLTRRGLTLSAVLAAVGLSQETVSAALLVSTAGAAMPFAAGSTAGVSAQLAEGVVKGMLLSKLKIAAAVVIAVSLVSVGAGLITHKESTAKQPETPKLAAAGAKLEKPEAKDEARTDQFGDPLPDGAVARLGSVRFNHGDPLNSLLFSPDGTTIISEGNGSLRLWDAPTGKELRTFATPASFSNHRPQTALSPDGKMMIFLSQDLPGDTVRVWDLSQGKEVRQVPLPVHRKEWSVFRQNALSPDGRLAAIHTPKHIQVFDIETAQELYKLPKGGDEVRAVIFAGNDRIVTADKKQVINFWDAHTGKAVRQFDHGSPVEFLAASADGCRTATLEHHTFAIDRFLDKDLVHVWDLTTGTRKRSLEARPKRWYMQAQFSPDGKLLVTSSVGMDKRELTVWNVETAEKVHELDFTAGNVLAFSPDSSRLAVARDVLDLKTGRFLSSEDNRHSFASTVFFSPSGDRLFTVGSSSISTWDATTGRRLRSFDVPHYYLIDPCPSYSPDGRYAITFEGEYKRLQTLLWDVVNSRRLHTLRPPDGTAPNRSAFSPDSSLLATWHPGKEIVIRIWDIRTGQEVRSFRETKAGWPGQLFFTADARTLLVAGKQHVVGLDAASGKELFSWRMEPLQSNSGVRVVVGGQPVNQADRNAWRTLAVSPQGTLVACILSGEAFSRERVEHRIALCEARTGRIIRRWNDSGGPSIMFEQLSFSHDERLLASSDGPVFHLWEVATGKEICTFQGHRGEIRSLAFSSNGRRLASASTDRTVLLWDLAWTAHRAAPLLKEAGEKEVAGWWADLASEEPSRAYAAVWQLSDAPAASVPFLRQRLRPVTEAQVREISQHLTDLDSNTFSVREKASERLKSLGVAAERDLRQELKKEGSPEIHRRIEQLLANLTNKPLSGEPLRTFRALAVLEHAGAPEARRLLRELAAGESGAWLTQEAKASLERLAKRP